MNQLLGGVSGDEQLGDRGQVKSVGQWRDSVGQSHGLVRVVCFPVFYGAYGLCLPVQVLKLSSTGCTEYTCDFCPPKLLVWVVAPYRFLLSSSLCIRLRSSEQQLLQFLWCWTLPHSRTGKHKVSLTASLLCLIAGIHPWRTHLSWGESCLIYGACRCSVPKSLHWSRCLHEAPFLKTPIFDAPLFLLCGSGVFSKALLLRIVDAWTLRVPLHLYCERPE